MTDTLKVETVDQDRTPEQAARAAPVSLPAGSYDAAELDKRLRESAAAKHDKDRDEVRQQIVAEVNETPLPEDTLGVPTGYKRVTVEDVDVGVTEERVVYDESQREAAEQAQDDVQEPIAPTPRASESATTKQGE